MGIGIRLFFFDDNSVNRFSVAKFQRLWNGNVNEKIPQYAGKMIKYAMVIVETENRQPIKIIHWECSYIRIDSKGRNYQTYRNSKRRIQHQTLLTQRMFSLEKNYTINIDGFRQILNFLKSCN